MPQAIAGVLVKWGLSKLAATIIAHVVTFAITFGLSQLFKPGRPKPEDGQIETREAVGSRRKHWGIVHTSGQVSFEASKNGTLGKVLTLGTGHENDIIEHRIHDEVVNVDGSGTISDASFKGAVHIITRPGDPNQSAIGELTAIFPEWTADHRQRGCAHVAIICDPVDQEDFNAVYNGRIPEYSQVRRGCSCYDPRQDSTAVIFDDGEGFVVLGTGPQRVDDPTSWKWSDNWALVTANYWADSDGYGGGYGNVNWTNIAIEAAVSDDQVPAAVGGTAARWRCWASYSLVNEDRKDVFADMLKAADGWAFQDANGKLNIQAGRWEEPDVTITDDAIKALSVEQGPTTRHRTSAIKVLYTESAIGYRQQEASTLTVPNSGSDPNSDPQSLPANYIPHHNQAIRVGYRHAESLDPDRWHLTALLDLRGLDLLGRRFCRLETDVMGIAAWFEIKRLRLFVRTKSIEAELSQVKPGDWLDDATAIEGTPPASSAPPKSDPTLAAPTGLALSAVALSFGDANGVAIAATWDDPGRKGLTFEAQLRETPAGEWVTMVIDDATFSARSGPVNSGLEHEVRVRARSIGGRTSAWSASEIITPTAATSVPAPTSLAAGEGAAGEAVIDWRNPQAAFDHVKLFENTADDLGTATQISGEFTGSLGELKTHTETGLAAGTHYFWARAYDAADNPSAATGPVTAVVT